MAYYCKFFKSSWDGSKSTVIRSGIVIIFLVFGCLTFLEDRFSLVKDPNPRKYTLSPFFRSAAILDRMNFIISLDSTWVRKNLLDIARINFL